MDTKPFLHEHYLIFDKYEEQEACCDKCNQHIYGWAYSCERCKFWLHKSCVEQQLPHQISACLFHSRHKLTRVCPYWSDYVCIKCFNLSRGHGYYCVVCDFVLEYQCAFLTNAEKNRSIINGHKSKQIQHFSLNRPLTLFNYRKVGRYDYCCSWCEKHLFGMSYGYVKGHDKICFHDSCLNNMPSINLKHPFHPSHLLQLCNSNFDIQRCNACNNPMPKLEKCYSCDKCNFYLHILCARLQPSLKDELHEHDLTYWPIKSYKDTFLCKICNFTFDPKFKKSAYYRCIQCDFSYHFNCLKIPSSITHKYHRHDLMLIDSFIEDDSKEYYCDICEEERKPKHHVYCCKKCKFVAHIECALNKVVDRKLDHGSTIGLLDSKASVSTVMGKEIKYLDHQHPLSYNEDIKQKESLFCNACCQEIFDQHYACEDCKYYIHETCTTLLYKVSHPLHRQHPLKLYTNIGGFICFECRDHSDGFVYMCILCDFKLDVKCATAPIASKNEGQRLIEMERLSKVCPFNQNHKLEFFNRKPHLKYLECHACKLPIVGPGYTCHDCSYTLLHESCLARMREMQHPFHPLHPLHPQFRYYRNCSACGFEIFNSICYSCQQCDFRLHLDCAKSLKLALKLKSHQHNLYYFGPNTANPYIICNKCQNHIGRAPSYYCMECRMRFHFQCVLIPHSIKSKCHVHPLTLKDHFAEDDSGEYYCDICEEERNSKNHVYCCEKCDGQFVAHIECVLPTEEQVEPAPEPSLIRN